MAVIQDININVYAQPSEKRLRTFLTLSQNENGRLINFRILGAPLPSNCVATFSGTKPDGNVYSTTGTVTGNFVVVAEDMQMTAVAGVWDAKLDIVNGTHNIMTALIRVVVDADVVDPNAIASDSQLQGLVAEAKYYAEEARIESFGAPLTATLTADMLDHTRVYVYTGSETGMSNGHWYYWDGSAWTDGGVYNAAALDTDKTLSVPDKAADGKATGDALALKVDKVTGKGLSTNDYTTAEKNKLSGIAVGATKVEIDTTLSTAGKAADAKETGDKISELKEDLTHAFPHDTVSGAVASFADGADDVPMDSVIVNIDPVQEGSGDPSPTNVLPISGWSEVNVKQSGKFNIGADYNSGDGYVPSVILKADNTTAENTAYFVTAYFPITPDSDCLVAVLGIYNAPAICFYDASKAFISGVSYSNRRQFTVRTPSNCAYARMTIYNTDRNVMGAYDNCTSLTIPLGQTVYGGNIDVTSGVLTVDRAMVDLGTLNWLYSSVRDFFYVNLTGIKYSADMISDMYKSVGIKTDSQMALEPTGTIGQTANSEEIKIRNTDYTNATAFKTAMSGVQLCYELAAPLTIQLTPHEVRSLLGSNNIWADTGDTEATYRADPTLYISRLTEPDADMIADANITSGQYFMVGNTLYKATANIASGATISPNVNCTRKSLSEALNELNA